MSGSPNPSPGHLSAADEATAQRKKLVRDAAWRRRREEMAEWFTYWLLLGGSLGVLLLAWWMTERMFRQPVKFPFAVQYASTSDREMNYELRFDDPSGVPKAVRQTLASERRQPSIVAAGSPRQARFEKAVQPVAKTLEMIVPPDTAPGEWSGRLVFTAANGRSVADLPVAVTVADPWRLWKIGLAGFGAFTALWYGALIYLRPSLRCRHLTLELTGYERSGQADAKPGAHRTSWFRRFVLLPRRHWASLREVHRGLPPGRIVSKRRGLLPGRKRVLLKIELDDVQPLIQTDYWPKSTKAIEGCGTKPSGRIEVAFSRTGFARLWCVTGPRDERGNAICFTILHPEDQKPRAT